MNSVLLQTMTAESEGSRLDNLKEDKFKEFLENVEWNNTCGRHNHCYLINAIISKVLYVFLKNIKDVMDLQITRHNF